jgi:HAD superfamily hydrolase (TIGR01459 family)
MKTIKGISDLVSEYDLFIVDAWGVLHEGARPFEHVEETLKRLKALGKTVIIVTNSPSRKRNTIKDLDERGISRDLYSDLVSSGEISYLLMEQRLREKTLPKKCFFLGQEKHLHLTEGLDVRLVSDPEEGSFFLNTGPKNPSDSLDLYEDLLATACARSLEMICVNPDRISIFQGQRRLCAGMLAELYEKLGGRVSSIGKPFPSIYRHILKGVSQRAVAIGDSLETDIQGGVRAQIDTILVFTGVTTKEMPLHPEPTYCMEELRW